MLPDSADISSCGGKVSWGGGGKVADRFLDLVEKKLQAWYPGAYQVEMVQPHHDGTTRFEDANIEIEFHIVRKQIEFSLKNKTSSPVIIDWQQWSFVGLWKGARNPSQGISYGDKDKPQHGIEQSNFHRFNWCSAS